MLVQVGLGLGVFSPSPAEIRAFLCVFICLWAVTFSPPILKSNISRFPPAISRLGYILHMYEAHFHELLFIIIIIIVILAPV